MIFRRSKMRIIAYYGRFGLVLLVVSLVTVIVFNSNWYHPTRIDDQTRKPFNIEDNGVIVVLDIPNTGMDSLADYMVRYADLNPPCQCLDSRTKCKCLTKNGHHWLFQAYNTTGYVCGEHADFTTLTNCPIDYWYRTSGGDRRTFRQYLLVTVLRDPLTRYVSEWLSLTHEDTYFKNEPRLFRNESVELQKKKFACYLGKRLNNLPLEDFLDCSENGARNRQTRMLANMTFVYSLKLSGASFQEALLASAKLTLKMIPFFGLYSRPLDTQKLLESTVGIRFKKPLSFEDTMTAEVLPLPDALKQQILQVNSLDSRLYQFAKDLFQERVFAMKFPRASTDSFENKESDNLPDLSKKGQVETAATVLSESVNKGGSDQFGGHISDFKEYGNNYGEEKSNAGQDIWTLKGTPRLDKRDDETVSTSESEMLTSSATDFEEAADVDPNSPDYNPDLEDVNVFLERLERVKQQKREAQNVPYQFQEQSNILPHLSNGIKNDNQLQREGADLGHESYVRGGTASLNGEKKTQDNLMPTDVKSQPALSKHGKSWHQKGVDRMFL